MQGSNKERDELSRKRRLSASIPISHQDLRDLFDPPDRPETRRHATTRCKSIAFEPMNISRFSMDGEVRAVLCSFP